jgi:hypothetical protein
VVALAHSCRNLGGDNCGHRPPSEIIPHQPPVKHLKLRIVWSVAWGIAAVLLIALWVHSLHRQIRLECWLANSLYVRSVALKHWVEIEPQAYAIGPPGTCYPRATFQDSPVNAQQEATASPVRRWRCSHSGDPTFSSVVLTVPFWFPIMATAPFGVIPWVAPLARLRSFSVRALLIATTLVAVGLGLTVWLTS